MSGVSSSQGGDERAELQLAEQPVELEPVGPSRETIEGQLRAARAQRPVLHDLVLDLLRQLDDMGGPDGAALAT